MLMMVLCDREGRNYDVWISFGSMHEVRAFRDRKKRGVWFRELVCLCMYMLMLLDIVITGGVNLRSNFSPSA